MAKSKGKDKKKAKTKVKAKISKPAKKAKSKPAAKKTSKPAKKAAPKAKKVSKPVKKAKVVAKKASKTKAKVNAKAKSAPKKKLTPKQKIKKVKAVKKITKKVISKAKPVAKKAEKPAKAADKKLASNKPDKPSKFSKEIARIVKAEIKPEPKVLYKTQPKPVQQLPKRTFMKKDLNLRYSDKELKEFKILIEKKLLDAREELKNLKEALDNHTESQAGNKAWNMEEGTDTSEMEYLMNQISRQHQYIRNLELALVRVENKTYGICRVTGKLIPKQRLRVVPHATLSLEAKMTRKTEEDTSTATTTAAPPTDFAENFED